MYTHLQLFTYMCTYVKWQMNCVEYYYNINYNTYMNGGYFHTVAQRVAVFHYSLRALLCTPEALNFLSTLIWDVYIFLSGWWVCGKIRWLGQFYKAPKPPFHRSISVYRKALSFAANGTQTDVTLILELCVNDHFSFCSCYICISLYIYI